MKSTQYLSGAGLRVSRAPALLGAALLGSVVLLAACGGGGDSGPVTSAADFPIASAVSAYAQSTHRFNLSGSLEGTNFTATFGYTPGPAATFEGRPALTATESVVLRATGIPETASTTTTYFALAPYTAYGSVDQTDGAYAVFQQTANLPATAKVGENGAIGTETAYASSAKTTVVSTTTVTWSLESDTPSTALFCLNSQISGPIAGSGSECYRVDTGGTVSGLLLRVNVAGKTLTLS